MGTFAYSLIVTATTAVGTKQKTKHWGAEKLMAVVLYRLLSKPTVSRQRHRRTMTVSVPKLQTVLVTASATHRRSDPP